ncbi:MAG: hypothetical protein NTX51_06010 [Verrucomicrobia bacterium]|nr:hypothetical protein [Verrucomicrobiota bacterium]
MNQPNTAEPTCGNRPGRKQTLLLCLVLALVTAAVYWPVARLGFINFDDPDYVSSNPRVQAGLTPESIKWAFTSLYASNWHPLTWLSHMLDCQIYHLKPAGHHVTSMLLHIANSLLLFGLLKRLTGAFWGSALVAALFALHPLHVESVAWVSERKDVLSTFFFMLTLATYCRYAREWKSEGRNPNTEGNPNTEIRRGGNGRRERTTDHRPRTQADAGDGAVRAAASRLLAAATIRTQHTGSDAPQDPAVADREGSVLRALCRLLCGDIPGATGLRRNDLAGERPH